ncbi:MAG: histidinol dehydrogenase [Planctomycetota bacterium]|nr:histidinol dehydrogenase [Planctomycetota bacterium]
MRIIPLNKMAPIRSASVDWERVLPEVEPIIRGVREKGDFALRRFTKRFDNITLTNLEVSPAERRDAYKVVSRKVITSLEVIIERIRAFARRQLVQLRPFKEQTKEGTVGQRIIPLDRIGVYVPGGRYPLPSSALMGIIPARVAGVREIIVCSPKIHPATIVAAALAGANRIFKVGGAQAIAAMAYGTQTIPEVDKIVGPGNRYVTAAKYLVSKDCGIDMLAGPSEIIIIADDSANPSWIAADLIAQAEHDIDAGIYCLTFTKSVAITIRKEINKQMQKQVNREIVQGALRKGSIIVCNNIKQCIRFANQRAPEHLALHIRNPESILSQLKNYGTLFLGPLSAVAFGDYVTGSNHILPTGGSAKYTAGLSVLNFLKFATYQSVKKQGVRTYTKIAEPLVRAEGLYAHLYSMSLRLPADKKN